ncbi:MAG TPA: ribonuclease III [Rhizomicrobium sp.]|jgi:ribonuclease-3|nr:ribonuclease III [Rhizomicrobium sp.]
MPGDLETRLGHEFHDPELLKRALTHASADAVRSNERLEFLGDRVLGLIVAEKLHALFPADAEGALALKFNALARGAACAAAAQAAGLGEHIILANSERASGGRAKPAILSGACEAVIAALYLDGGLDAARAFVERYWVPMFAGLGADMRDAKTRLQEWAQARGRDATAPVYTLVGREGPDHAPRFLVEAYVSGHPPEHGEGGSKREAEQDAAGKLLVKVVP